MGNPIRYWKHRKNALMYAESFFPPFVISGQPALIKVEPDPVGRGFYLSYNNGRGGRKIFRDAQHDQTKEPTS